MRRYRARFAFWTMFGIAVLSFGRAENAWADEPAPNEAQARVLFGEARQLADDGHYDVACPRFEAARKLFASAGVLANLADCYEKMGRTASAWTTFGEAAAAATRTNRADAATEAKRRQALLEGQLARVLLVAPHEVPGLVVKRDGAEVPRPLWSVATPVDPGGHEIRAEAVGYGSWSRAIVAPAPGQTATIEVPELRPTAAPVAPVAATPDVSAPIAPVVSAPIAPVVSAPIAPPPEAAPATPPPPAARAEEKARDDSNPRHEWLALDVALGPGYATLASVDSVDFSTQNSSGAGPVISAGADLRVSFLTLGARVRDLQLSNLTVWEIDAETAFHAHIDTTDVYLGLRGGYAFGSMSTSGDVTGASTPNADITGFNVGAMIGFDSYIGSTFSWGLEVNPEALELSRPPLPLPAGVTLSDLTPQEQALYQASGLSIGLAFAGTAHVRLHF